MPSTRGGHHGDVAYVFEDDGFNSAPNDTDFKVFGGNTVLDTFDGSHQAVRIFNAERYAANIIEQTFDGAFSITCENFTEPPWWLAGLFGQPNSTNVAGNLYDHTYDLDNDNDPVSLRLYLPTDGFNEYKVIPGAVIASVTVDQGNDSGPDLTISGAYASEPFTESSLSPSSPDFAEESFLNRDATLTVDGNDVARAQSTTLSIESNTEMIGEIGAEDAVDFTPRAWEPSLDFEKIITVGQTTDVLTLFSDATQFATTLDYNNGESSDAEYGVTFDVSGDFPGEYSESGRNDPEADLTEDLSTQAEDVDATITEDAANPPGVSP